ncbi:hypothetical protein AYO44_05275 [Planctomycetaceae bacterium SCGC AG-212-F19]|nr:hypothetical protein AYO44_05275 [Planctomycetaceae bacterium SCGC AG-212-F19]
MTIVGTTNEQARTLWVEACLRSLPAGARILDAGAGEQPFRKCCAHLNYVAQDFGAYKPKAQPAGLHLANWDYGKLDIVSDLTAIPEPDGSFDAILCTEVLEHVPDPVAAIRELVRLLKPQGTLLLTAPFCSLTHFAPYHYVTGFNRYFYEKHLPDNGLNIIELTPNGSYFDYLAQEICRLPTVAHRYAAGSGGWLSRFVFRLALHVLQRWAQLDSGSSELLTYGYHVKAVKRPLDAI